PGPPAGPHPALRPIGEATRLLPHRAGQASPFLSAESGLLLPPAPASGDQRWVRRPLQSEPRTRRRGIHYFPGNEGGQPWETGGFQVASMAARLPYRWKGWNCRGPAKYRDMLLDVGTEE